MCSRSACAILSLLLASEKRPVVLSAENYSRTVPAEPNMKFPACSGCFSPSLHAPIQSLMRWLGWEACVLLGADHAPLSRVSLERRNKRLQSFTSHIHHLQLRKSKKRVRCAEGQGRMVRTLGCLLAVCLSFPSPLCRYLSPVGLGQVSARLHRPIMF